MHGSTIRDEITATAARLIAEDGLEYGAAKRRAARMLGLGSRAALPDNEAIDEALRDYIAEFLSDSQPGELLALRTLALQWMRRQVGAKLLQTAHPLQGERTQGQQFSRL